MKEQLPSTWRMYGRMVAWVLTVLYAVGLAGHIASDPLEQFMAFLTPEVSV